MAPATRPVLAGSRDDEAIVADEISVFTVFPRLFAIPEALNWSCVASHKIDAK
ncbi:hypothetical protein [Pseudoxanthomonas dokdonensis]|uniref:hypothetical protein n=1 Tax=Pseudoxanthomonas dokdonensis TaxID=344882 RepID=UPI000A5466D2|nr:hypothetical protein [Pseudoxanthomonas dokdonensis]